MRKISLLLIFSGFFLFSCRAGAITLDEAIDVALKNNFQILIAQEKVKEAEEKLKQAQSEFFPSLDLTGSYTHLGKIPVMSTPFGDFPMAEQDTTSLTLSLTQPIYTSGKLTLGLRQAKLNLEKAIYELENEKSRLAFLVKEAFYSVILARENVDIAEKALKQAERHLEVVESFYSSGRASRFDLLRAKVEVANLKPELIRAKNNLTVARENLARLLSLPPSSVEPEEELKFEPLGLTLDEAIDVALSSRKDLKSLLTAKKIAEIAFELGKIKNTPTLSFLFNYEYETSSTKDEWEDSWNANLVLSFPLYDFGRKKASTGQLESQLRQIELAIKELEEGIKIEVKKAFFDMKAAAEAISAQSENVKQAEEALNIAEGRYKSGIITQLEVLDAALALTKARLNYTKALYDYSIAEAALMRAMGRW
ncbi:TolC family protein [Candidatus Aerophobetes bacterium]|nr:TolC family protein [Candidatus Aerophobetes bacterium]